MRLGKHGAGEEGTCLKAGDEKGKLPCVSRIELHTGQVPWRVVGELGRGWVGHGANLDFVLREMGTKGNL